MNIGEYQQMYELEGFYWWFVARRKLLRDLVGRRSSTTPLRILDVGSGTGYNHTVLSEFGSVINVDFSVEALRLSRERGLANLVLSNAEEIGLRDNCVDLATALDVLEHTDDDLAAMQELRRTLRPGGTLVLTVPAYGFLWSEHDEALHHRRRYTASELCNKLRLSGFHIEFCSYYITLLFFPVLLMRILQNIGKNAVRPQTSHVILPGWLNSFLIRLLDLERWLLLSVKLPFGVTVACVATKPVAVEQHAPCEQPEAAAVV